MSLRRLHSEQPESFAFTQANLDWAQTQIAKFPEGRQASAIIPLLWRAQEQEGWLSKPAIEAVAEMLGLPAIRALEVATFYFMFQLQPVGSIAHVQICGTTSCMICGAEDLIGVCREKIAGAPHALSDDGKFSWEEVECLGACANAPMVQIGKDYYEDLTVESFAELLDQFARGEVPPPGSRVGRYASEPIGGLTSLNGNRNRYHETNASVSLAAELGDTIVRITGEETRPTGPSAFEPEDRPVPPPAETLDEDNRVIDDPAADAMERQPDIGGEQSNVPIHGDTGAAKSGDRDRAPAKDRTASGSEGTERKPMPRLQPTGIAEDVASGAAPGGGAVRPDSAAERAPELLDRARSSGADDLKRIKGVGPKIETTLNELGIWHFDQIATWGPEEIVWVETRLSFKGRIERDGWIAQARVLAGE